MVGINQKGVQFTSVSPNFSRNKILEVNISLNVHFFEIIALKGTKQNKV